MPTAFRPLFWASFPAFLLLLDIGVSLLSPSSINPFLPFLALGGFAAIYQWKHWGLVGCYGAIAFLYVFVAPPQEMVWHLSLLTGLALSFLIVWLSLAEFDACMALMQKEGEKWKKQAQEEALALQRAQQVAAEVEHELQEEIQRLKAEAEVRVMQIQEEKKKMGYVESEIELLTSQKDRFVAETQKARVEVHAMQQQLLEEKKGLEEREQELRFAITQLQERLLQEPIYVEEINTLKKALAEADCVQQQLVEEKKGLDAREQELSLAITQLQERLLQEPIYVEEIDTLKKALAEADSMQRQLTEEKQGLEARAQERLLQEPPQLEEINILKKALAEAQGKAGQIRSQFDEKSQILSAARKELFHVKEKLAALEMEGASAALLPNRDEARHLEGLLESLVQEVVALEQEVLILEELIHSLTLAALSGDSG